METILRRSPALSLVPPEVLGSVYSPGALDRQRGKWASSTWPESSVTVREVANALVFPRGLVVDSRGEAVSATVAGFSEAEVADARSKAAVLATSVPRIAGTHVLAVRPGVTCYGHVLVEMLPAAWLVSERASHPGVLIGAPGGGLARIAREVLHQLGYSDVEITEANGPVVVDSLLVIEGFAETADYVSPLIVEYAHKLAEAAEGSAGLGPLLYLPRKPAYGRGIVNERAVAEALSAYGFVPVYPEDLSFADQIAAFRDARVIVGVMGSALTNVLFSRPGARVLALAPEFMVDTFFWRVAGCVGADYAELRCVTADSEKFLRTDRLLDRDIDVEVDVLMRWVEGAVKGARS